MAPVFQSNATRHLSLLTTPGFAGYALLDSGEGRKLERFGTIFVNRPEPQALWRPTKPQAWKEAHAVFSASAEDEEKGKWRLDRAVPESWPVKVPLPAKEGGVTMLCRLQGLWHLGLFPEQFEHWKWMLERVAEVKASGETPRVLNVFAYTGAASLIAAAAGAEVTHVDASKKSIAWGKDNQAASALSDAKIRWIFDDAAKFLAREVRRERRYHVVLLDPPKFGRGPNGEIWDLFAGLPGLLADSEKLLAPRHASLVLTVYAIRASALAFGQLVEEKLAGRKGKTETGELAIMEEGGKRLLPTSLQVRWRADD